MENYICINGKKAELTKEQMKALGIELPNAIRFDRKTGQKYFHINSWGKIDASVDSSWFADAARYDVANYCTDKAIMEYRALHETLHRLLWRYSLEHNGDKIDWNNYQAQKYYIGYHHGSNTYDVKRAWMLIGLGDVYFYSREIAENAIEEVVKPFIAAHPNFNLAHIAI